MIYFTTDIGIQDSCDSRKETIDMNLLNVCPESERSPPARCEVHGHSASAEWESVTQSAWHRVYFQLGAVLGRGEVMPGSHVHSQHLPTVGWHTSPSMRDVSTEIVFDSTGNYRYFFTIAGSMFHVNLIMQRCSLNLNWRNGLLGCNSFIRHVNMFFLLCLSLGCLPHLCT